MSFWKFMAFTQAACQAGVLAVVWVATGHLNLVSLALGIACLLAGLWLVDLDRETKPSKTLGVNSTHTTSNQHVSSWQPILSIRLQGPLHFSYGQSTHQTTPSFPYGSSFNRIIPTTAPNGQARYQAPVGFTQGTYGPATAEYMKLMAQQLNQQLGVMLVAEPDPLESIKQSVGCTHAISAFRLQSHPATRFLHEGDSFDLLPQYDPVPEVTAWLTSVCHPDNLELWLVGVPQVTPCDPDWAES